MAENNLEILGGLQMIPLGNKAIAIATIAMVEMHPITNTLSITLVGGKKVCLDAAESKTFLEIVSAAVYNAKLMAAQQGVIRPH